MVRDFQETINDLKKRAPELLHKSYDQILDVFETNSQKDSGIAIRALCLALVVENPTRDNQSIRRQVLRDCLSRKICQKTMVYYYYPDWIRRQRRNKDNFPVTGKSESQTLNPAIEVIVAQNKKLPESLGAPWEEEEGREEEQEEEQERTAWQRYGDINQHQIGLWNALTKEEHMPSIEDDLIVDHIKPTRTFRKWVFDELGSMERQGVLRRCSDLRALLEDTMVILEEMERKEES